VGGTLAAEAGTTLHEARRLHVAGDLEGAERIYRRLIDIDPDHVEVWYLLGRACHARGRASEAIVSYRRALALEPGLAEAHNNLGIALNGQGQHVEAAESYRQAIGLKPDYVEAHNNLGNVLDRLGHPAEAVESLRNAIRLRPDFAEAHNNLGIVLKGMKAWAEATACLLEAVRIAPHFAEAHSNLGIALGELREDDRAMEAYRRAIVLKPDLASAFAGMGQLLATRDKIDEAEDITREGLRRRPDSAELLANLGFLLAEQGLIPEGLQFYRGAIELKSDSASTWSNYLYHLNYDPSADSETLLQEHRQGARSLGSAPALRQFEGHDWTLDRPLRVGYVSPDFRHHAVASFLEPILANHDPSRVEVYCYSDVGSPDATTERLRGHARTWREIRPLSDDAVEALILGDRIDILVDLAGHTARNRLNVFARKPAPVQVTYLGYPGTTGLATIDAMVTDAIIDPVDRPPSSTESPLRLPSTFCCYAPPEGSGEVAPSPALRDGFPTFGSLHKLSKLNPQVIDLWSCLLRAVPCSRLILVRDRLRGRRGKEILEQFAAKGIDPGRVRLEFDWTTANHWERYASIDLSLDVFPWSGHTTACESLWMGVPIVTLVGERRSSRMTASVLSSLGLTDLIAESPEQYIEIAVRWVGDPPRLADWRGESRERLRSSRLFDGPAFTRDLEDAYVKLWARECDRKGSTSPDPGTEG
jgi:protein O-GlcNAc transferase